jgi:hypothetical protein
MVKIALDYDGTYDKAPEFWDMVIALAVDYGHDIRVVTHRHDKLDYVDDQFDIPVIYTDGVAKKWWCEHRTDFQPDIWIDDKPKGILENGPLTQKEIEEWRAARQT